MNRLHTVICICLLPIGLAGQTPDWEAYLLVNQPWNGNTDTIWFGLDANATNGFDLEYDHMDTTFSYPLSIRLNNDAVELDSGACAANMRRDIKPFAPEVSWDVYVKADSFDGLDITPPYDSVLFLRWDTAQFNYIDEQYFLKYAVVKTTTGYIGGIDGTGFCLSLNSGSCDGESGGLSEQVPLRYIKGIQPPEYTGGLCSKDEYIFKFTLNLVFDDLLKIVDPQVETVQFQQDIQGQRIQIVCEPGYTMAAGLYNTSGSLIWDFYGNRLITELQYDHLPKGLYILKVDINNNKNYFYKLLIN